ncbi:Ras-like protein family member 10B [Taenia crassiceps]|uniref:Ras-like protein family member 10B n=1 Tax=Taenia crassiceps TaxID=6207 RepID=A0ABR4QRG3_9CEST
MHPVVCARSPHMDCKSNSEGIPQTHKISSHGGDRASNLCEAGGVQSSLKTAQRGKRASSTPKKLYFRIENNVFYDPVSEKQTGHHVRWAIRKKDRGCYNNDSNSNTKDTKSNTREVEKRESRFKLLCAFRHAANLNAMVEMAASDPILTARHLSDDGTARLASWIVSEATPRPIKPKPRESASWMANVRAWTKAATCGRSGIVEGGRWKEAPKQESVKTSKTQPKWRLDLSHVKSNLSTFRLAPLQTAPPTPANVKTLPVRTNVSAEIHCESSEELGYASSDMPPPDLPRNPFESVIINIPVLGFRRCGKTSLLNSLVQTGPTASTTSSTRAPTYYYPMVVFNYQVFHFRLIDCPMMLQNFPLSTLDAWTDFRGWGLHVADFFILVFDITCELSFQYMKLLREQILATNMDVPMVIVANKIDLLKTSSSTGTSHHSLTATPPSLQRLGKHNSRVFSRNHLDGRANSGDGIYASCPSHISLLPHTPTPIGLSHKMAFRRDVTLLVKKHWKGCVLVECSALYNFNTLAILREVLRFVQYRQCSQKLSTAQTAQAVWQRNQCRIL